MRCLATKAIPCDCSTIQLKFSKLQRIQFEELINRAEPGSREIKLEKRKEVNEMMRQFRDPSPGADEVGDRELMGRGGW